MTVTLTILKGIAMGLTVTLVISYVINARNCRRMRDERVEGRRLQCGPVGDESGFDSAEAASEWFWHLREDEEKQYEAKQTRL